MISYRAVQFVGGLLSAKMLAGVEVAVEFWLALGHKSAQPHLTHSSEESDVLPNEVGLSHASLPWNQTTHASSL